MEKKVNSKKGERLSAENSKKWKEFRTEVKSEIAQILMSAPDNVVQAFAVKGAVRAFDEKFSSAADKLAVMEKGFEFSLLTAGDGLTKKEIAAEIQAILRRIGTSLSADELSEVFACISDGSKELLIHALGICRKVQENSEME